MNESSFAFFAVCAPGLETALAEELQQLGYDPHPVSGGVEGRTSLRELRRMLSQSRLAESLRVRLRAFRASNFGTLERELARLPWHAYLRPGQSPEVSVTCHKSRLYHSDAVAERVTASIQRSLSGDALPSVDGAEPPAVFVRLDQDMVQVSIDASGERLHRRGYRTHVVDAPLRETLAAALCRFAIANGATTRVWDPFCGSGTLPLEWLGSVLARDVNRGHYAMDTWPLARNADWVQPLVEQTTETASPIEDSSLELPHAWLTDVAPRAIAAAQHNAEQSQLAARCTFACADFDAAEAAIPAGTAVLANPPYGVRLQSARVAEQLFHRFSRMLSRRVDLRPAIVIVPTTFAVSDAGRHWQVLARFLNGGVPVCALLFRDPS